MPSADLLFAAAPVLLLIVLMTRKAPMPSARALPLAAVVVYALQLLWFGVEGTQANAAVIAGLLVAVVDTGSITGSAQRLGVTQSAVSHLLDKLRSFDALLRFFNGSIWQSYYSHLRAFVCIDFNGNCCGMYSKNGTSKSFYKHVDSFEQCEVETFSFA